MPTNPWSPNSQYLSTVLNDPAAIPSHAAPASATPHSSTPPRPRQTSGQLQQAQAQQGPFTAAQRSAQARGKPFDTWQAGSSGRGGRHNEPESYAQRQKRSEAAAILDSQEMLLWYSAARHESVTQTRQYYLDIVLGVEQAPKDWKEEWEVQHDELAGPAPSPKGKSPKGKGREREKLHVKKRYSGGGPHVTYGEGS